jgi:dipeptidyl aminopeptidase/acylaminoacyl peptidase
LAGAVAVLGVVLYVGGNRWYYRMVPPDAGAGESGAEEAGFRGAKDAGFRGSIVWSSNRSGSHEIYRLDVGDGKSAVARLTEHPHVDTFPRFSPDGRRILFNRSRKPWVSFRDPAPWDVWIMNRDGGAARRVAEHGFHASFTPDGRHAVFARGEQVVRVPIDGGGEKVLVDAGRSADGWVQEPDLRGSLLAGTVRGGRRAFGIFDLDTRRFAPFPGDGCQIAWWPARKRLVWVDGDAGHGGNRFVSARPDGSRVKPLLDLPGSHSHEYFPRLSSNGAWLVFGASSGGHEHDRADYEIFLWRVGAPATEAIRLTRHSGNDQWPDVFPDRAES